MKPFFYTILAALLIPTMPALMLSLLPRNTPIPLLKPQVPIPARSPDSPTFTGPLGEKFTLRVVASHLSDPWEVTYGPDGYLWVAEAKGYRISRIDPHTGKKEVLLQLENKRNFPRYDVLAADKTGGKPWPEGGLTGMALHPQLLRGKPYVYLAYIYRFQGANGAGNGCTPNYGGCFFTTRIVRYTYNVTYNTLTDPVILCDSIPGSSDNNAGRLLVAPVGSKQYLFYGIGDMGAGQFDNAARPNHAQQKDSYEGKILRFNTEPDSDSGPYDRWIPNDNPFNGYSDSPASRSFSGPPDPSPRSLSAPDQSTVPHQSAVWSYGHRNPEGLAYTVIDGVGRLYSSEHGPYSDDEINIIEKGMNYGHPLIFGYTDGNYDSLAGAVSNYPSVPGPWHTSYPTIDHEGAFKRLLGPDYREPLMTFYPNSHALLDSLFHYIRSTGKEGKWPSEAPGSLDVYTSPAIPGWRNSLLMPTLKGHQLIRLQLSPAGDRITGDTLNYFKGIGRLRDIALAPDGQKLYLAVDSANFTSVPSKDNIQPSRYRGCILEFTYQGNPSRR